MRWQLGDPMTADQYTVVGILVSRPQHGFPMSPLRSGGTTGMSPLPAQERTT